MGIAYTHEGTTSITVTNHTYILANFNFRMASNESLNAACNLDGYLFCKMTAGALEVEVKVKTTWQKFSMVQDIHTRTEKYHAWEKADGSSNIKTRKRKAPHKITNMQTEDNTSETNVLAGQGFRYPLRSSQTTCMQQQCPPRRKKEKQNRKVNSWASIVSFVIGVVKHIAGVILLIGKKEC